MKKPKILTLGGAGDALFVANLPKSYGPELEKIRAVIAGTDLSVVNLETNLGHFGNFASSFSGGTWLNTEPEVFADLQRYGFGYFGTANNHSMDYSYHGLLSTNEVLDEAGLAHSGTGKSLDEAGAPAIIRTPNGTVGVIAVTTTFENASKAGEASLGYTARPGVNFVRSSYHFHISAEELEALRRVAVTCGINDERNRDIAEGYTLPDPEGVFNFGGFCFTTEEAPTSFCHPRDLARVCERVRQAKEICDAVVVLTHSHESGGTRHSDVPDFLKELNRALIDAGASAVFGGGEHELRPVEVYHGAPIFYSLADFIYQGPRVPFLPADFMEKYGLPANTEAKDALWKRSQNGKVGLHMNRANYLTVLPVVRFADGKAISAELHPIDLRFEKPEPEKGLPCLASAPVAREIFGILSDLSAPFGTSLTLTGGTIQLNL